jgi:DNA-binding GntR family transcriptional regulator
VDSRDKPGHDEKRVLFNLLESIENARRIFSQALVELRRNRIAVVATPSWQEARDAFDVRIELERPVVRQLAGKLTKAQIAALYSHVDAEDAARDGPDAVSIRLATEFHILLASMTNSPILVRYVSEVA